MQQLTDTGRNFVNDVSNRYGLSQDAVIHMLIAVNNGGGGMAQFNCPELGGSGQWMRGGMTMVGDMFNNGLKNTVDNLCNELANGLANMTIFPVIPAGTPGSNQWWPANLGQPFSSGAQNNLRYAVFPNRLAVEMNGAVTVYDTLNHSIGSVSQQQGGNQSLTFSSQFGSVSVDSLPVVSGNGSQPATPAPQTNFAQPSQSATYGSQSNTNTSQSTPNHQSSINSDEVFALLEKLGGLLDAGILTQDEFNAKKAELLNRI
ncbi:SHOCT domain-containing protein [Marinomonas piezotolerans]|uniref:SHOCT domain-containing protein n=1 Tax=Marinomonas piezotolerans TaxID=2213058 RepID=A0A370UC59_9GAMM|nr:SHOCT domain-containing protein [Marinomonas piezotolerans]RDL45392.1 SHOCT domain-containing protein [Marinomonas piezotolerans]